MSPQHATSHHPSGTNNFEMGPRFLENLCSPAKRECRTGEILEPGITNICE
jgi:hypothetical protein